MSEAGAPVRAILTYHSIDPSGSPVSIDREVFARHVRWLAASDVRVVPLDELLALPPRTDAVALTFDDAFANFGTEAWPLLAEHGLPATLYVVTDHAGGANDWGGAPAPGIPTLPLLGWDALGALAEAGVTLGVHGRRHVAAYGLARPQLEDELLGARARIRQETGVRCGDLAWPYGKSDGLARCVAREHFERACSTSLRVLREHENLLALPRVDAWYLQAPGRLEAWGTAGLARYLLLRGLLRRLRRRD